MICDTNEYLLFREKKENFKDGFRLVPILAKKMKIIEQWLDDRTKRSVWNIHEI